MLFNDCARFLLACRADRVDDVLSSVIDETRRQLAWSQYWRAAKERQRTIRLPYSNWPTTRFLSLHLSSASDQPASLKYCAGPLPRRRARRTRSCAGGESPRGGDRGQALRSEQGGAPGLNSLGHLRWIRNGLEGVGRRLVDRLDPVCVDVRRVPPEIGRGAGRVVARKIVARQRIVRIIRAVS
jgi:hypothetical protein